MQSNAGRPASAGRFCIHPKRWKLSFIKERGDTKTQSHRLVRHLIALGSERKARPSGLISSSPRKNDNLYGCHFFVYPESRNGFLSNHLICNYNLVTFAVDMGTKEKLIQRFKTIPSDFTFDELERLLSTYGFERSNKGKTSGSRVVFKNQSGTPIMLHKPHPGNIVKTYALRQVMDELKNKELIWIL